ncbi:MAG: transposase [Ruminococcaceae bacterium]|nr:transposase [Oscillospiraceae bacterium]
MATESIKSEYRLLFLIASPKLALKAEQLYKKGKVPMQYHVLAKGTASGEIKDILGLGEIEKNIIISMMQKEKASKMLEHLKNRLYLGTPNTGIAFTIPLSGGSAAAVRIMQKAENDTRSERTEVEKMKNKHVMIMAFVNQGFSEEVMAAAKPAGAGGGTVFHSRRVCSEEAIQLWGITIQQEREIVLILAEEEKKVAIMQAITEKCGAQSDAHGIVVSMPVDEVAGLNKYESLSL